MRSPFLKSQISNMIGSTTRTNKMINPINTSTEKITGKR